MPHAGFFETFELLGEWWLPESPKNRVYGQLKHTDSSTHLDLSSSLTGSSAQDSFKVLVSGDDRPAPPVIFGLTRRGEHVTLFDNSAGPSETNFETGNVRESFNAMYLVTGAHIPDLNDPCCLKGEVHFTNWEAWLGARPASTTREDGGAAIKIRPREPFSAHVDAVAGTFTFEHSTYTSSVTYSELTAKFTSRIALRSDTPQSLSYYVKHFGALQNLLTLLTGTPTQPTTFFLHSSRAQNVPPHLYHHLHKNYKPESASSHFMFASFPNCPRFGEMLEHWYGRADLLEVVFGLFFGSLYNRLQLRFHYLNIMHALETYCRETRPGVLVPKAEFKRIREAMAAAIPDDVTPEVRTVVENAISYWNEPSLQTRIMQLIGEFSPAEVGLFCTNAKQFVKRIVATRNYLTHYSKRDMKNVFMGTDLFHAFNRVRVLFTIVLFRELGFSSDEIVALFGHETSPVQGFNRSWRGRGE